MSTDNPQDAGSSADERGFDESMFVFDTAGNSSDGEAAHQHSASERSEPGSPDHTAHKTKKRRVAAPVWQDDDDDGLQVDIESKQAPARVRKLRESTTETSISGSVYAQRLREQLDSTHAGVWQSSLGGLERKVSAATGRTSTTKLSAHMHTTASLHTSSKTLSELSVTRLADLRGHQGKRARGSNKSNGGAMTSLRFHPRGDILVSAGLNKEVCLYSVSAASNLVSKTHGKQKGGSRVVRSLYTADLPVRQAEWVCASPHSSQALTAQNAHEVWLAGRRRHFCVYDLLADKCVKVRALASCGHASLEKFAVPPLIGSGPAAPSLAAFVGNHGVLEIVSTRSKQHAFSLKQPGLTRSLAFVPGSVCGGSASQWYLASYTRDSQVCLWDLRTRRCVNTWQQADAVHGCSLASDAVGGFMVLGNDSGVVNLYAKPSSGAKDTQKQQKKNKKQTRKSSSTPPSLKSTLREWDMPTLSRSFSSLTTPADILRFSNDGQLMAMASSQERDALRIVHAPSATVFSNWPTGRTPLHYVTCVDFSPRNGILAVGNARGRGLLYRLLDYHQV